MEECVKDGSGGGKNDDGGNNAGGGNGGDETINKNDHLLDVIKESVF